MARSAQTQPFILRVSSYSTETGALMDQWGDDQHGWASESEVRKAWKDRRLLLPGLNGGLIDTSRLHVERVDVIDILPVASQSLEAS